MKINNRRYIGNKTKLLDYIYDCVPNELRKEDIVFADLFAGTGAVASHFAEKGFKIIANDILYSNYVAYKAWLSNDGYNEQVVQKYIDIFNKINYDDIKDNYFSAIYSNKYFSYNDAKKIGYIRELIEEIKKEIREREYFILLSSLLYVTDKIANTVGHFEYFLKKQPIDTHFKLEMPTISLLVDSQLYNIDANKLGQEITCDIAYIDPPYNARQYVNFYHVLENLARWDKPEEFEGNSMKFKRDHLKSGYSKAQAPKLFESLIQSLNSKLIIVSYNNTYNASSGASINKISETEIIEILSKKGVVSKRAIDYSFFNAGKTDFKNHQEFLFVCEVNK